MTIHHGSAITCDCCRGRPEKFAEVHDGTIEFKRGRHRAHIPPREALRIITGTTNGSAIIRIVSRMV